MAKLSELSNHWHAFSEAVVLLQTKITLPLKAITQSCLCNPVQAWKEGCLAYPASLHSCTQKHSLVDKRILSGFRVTHSFFCALVEKRCFETYVSSKSGWKICLVSKKRQEFLPYSLLIILSNTGSIRLMTFVTSAFPIMKYLRFSGIPVSVQLSGKDWSLSASTGVRIRSFPVSSSGMICVERLIEPSLVSIVLPGSSRLSSQRFKPWAFWLKIVKSYYRVVYINSVFRIF